MRLSGVGVRRAVLGEYTKSAVLGHEIRLDMQETRRNVSKGIEFSDLWADAEYEAAGCDVTSGVAECLDFNSINSQRISECFGTGG